MEPTIKKITNYVNEVKGPPDSSNNRNYTIDLYNKYLKHKNFYSLYY